MLIKFFLVTILAACVQSQDALSSLLGGLGGASNLLGGLGGLGGAGLLPGGGLDLLSGLGPLLGGLGSTTAGIPGIGGLLAGIPGLGGSPALPGLGGPLPGIPGLGSLAGSPSLAGALGLGSQFAGLGSPLLGVPGLGSPLAGIPGAATPMAGLTGAANPYAGLLGLQQANNPYGYQPNMAYGHHHHADYGYQPHTPYSPHHAYGMDVYHEHDLYGHGYAAPPPPAYSNYGPAYGGNGYAGNNPAGSVYNSPMDFAHQPYNPITILQSQFSSNDLKNNRTRDDNARTRMLFDVELDNDSQNANGNINDLGRQ